MSIKKHGGIWFIQIGRVGFNFYLRRRNPETPTIIESIAREMQAGLEAQGRYPMMVE